MKIIRKIMTVLFSTIMLLSSITTNVIYAEEDKKLEGLYFIDNIYAYDNHESFDYKDSGIWMCAGDSDALFVYVDSEGEETNVSHAVEFSSDIQNITKTNGTIDFGNGPVNVLSLDIPTTGTATVTYSGKTLTININYPGFFAIDKDGRIRRYFNLDVGDEIEFGLFYDNNGTPTAINPDSLTTSGTACTYDNGTLTAVEPGEFHFEYPNPFNDEEKPFSLSINVNSDEGQNNPPEPQYTDYNSNNHKGEKKHVTNQEALEAALSELSTAYGGVIYIDGAIPEGGTDRVLSISGNLPIYHMYPDNQNSQNIPDLSHPSYDDFLLIDLQCDVVTDGTIIINGHEGSSTPDDPTTYSANVLINGNGHSITSSALATLSTSYRANVTVANTKIINTNTNENAAAVLMAAGTFTADRKVELEGPIGLHVIPADMKDAGSQSSSINIEGTVIGTKNAGFVADGQDEYEYEQFVAGEGFSKVTAYRNAWFFGTINNLETEANDYAAIMKGNSESQLDVGNSNGGIYLANGRLNVFGEINSNSDCIDIDNDVELISPTKTYVNIRSNAMLNSVNGSCIKELTQSTSNINQIKIVGGNFICNSEEEMISLSSDVTKEANNIDITGGKYSKKFYDNYKKSNTEWKQQQDGMYLLKDNSGVLKTIADLASFKTAISEGNTNLQLLNSITLDGKIEIPYQINIDLNKKTITGGCLYFNAPQIEGASLDSDSKSILFGGNLVATTDPIVETNGLLILRNADVSNGSGYDEYLLSVVGDGSLDIEGCNVHGNMGINLDVSRFFHRNSTELNTNNSTITTTDVAVNAKGLAEHESRQMYPEFTIAFGQGTQIISDTTAVKSDTVKVLLSGASITGKTCIDTNFAIDLDQRAVLNSVKPQGDEGTEENAAIIINGPENGNGRTAYFEDNESSLVSSDYDYAVILKGNIGSFVVKHGNYFGTNGVIDITNLTSGSDQIRFDRGRLSHDINDSYVPDGFECIKVDKSEMPYAIVRKYAPKIIGAYSVQPYLLDELSSDVTIDSDALADALGDSITSNATLIFSATEEDKTKAEELNHSIGDEGNIVDCYDLHIDQKINDTFKKLDSVSSLQTISIPLSNEAKNHKDNLVIYHENEPMNLVTKEVGVSATNECAYIDNDVLVIKTNRFSSFSVVNTDPQTGEDCSLDLNFRGNFGSVYFNDSSESSELFNQIVKQGEPFTLYFKSNSDEPIIVKIDEDGQEGEHINKIYSTNDFGDGTLIDEGNGKYKLVYTPSRSQMHIGVAWSQEEFDFNNFYIEESLCTMVNKNGAGSTNISGAIYEGESRNTAAYGGEIKSFTSGPVTVLLTPDENSDLFTISLNDVIYSQDGTIGGPEDAKGTFASLGDKLVYDQSKNTYSLILDNDDYQGIDHNVFVFVEFSGQEGPGLDDADLIINGKGYMRFEDEDNGYNIYRPMQEILIPYETVEAIAGDRKNIIAYVNVELENDPDYVGYFDGYYYRKNTRVEFALYELPNGLTQKEINLNDLQDYRIDDFGDHEAVIEISMFFNKDRNYLLHYGSSLANFDFVNGQYEYTNMPIEINPMWYEDIKQYSANLVLKFTGAGTYNICKAVEAFDEREEDITGIDTSVLIENIFGSGTDNLDYLLRKLIKTSGKELKLAVKESGYDLTGPNNTLIIRNFATTSDCKIGDYSTDICINLNGQTLNFGKNHLELGGGSKVHIINGTITGSADDYLIADYGNMILENVTVNYSGEGTAVICKGGMFTLDQLSTINATAGSGILIDSKTTGNIMENHSEANVRGKIFAYNDGVVSNGRNDSDFFVRLLAADDGNRNVISNQPTIEATNGVGIKANGKTTVRIGGYNDNTNVCYAKIKANEAISVNGGELIIRANTQIESIGDGLPAIEVQSTNEGANQTISIDTSCYQYITSKDNIVEETGDVPMVESLSIFSNGDFSNAKFDYPTTITYPFEFNNSNPSTIITAGYYVTNIFGGQIVNGYECVATGNLYKVIPAGGYHEFETFTATNPEDTNDSEMDLFKNYMESPNVANVSLDTDVTAKSLYTITVTSPKNLNLNGHTLKNVKFIVNELNENSALEFWGGESGATISSNDTIIDLKRGSTRINDMHLVSTSTEKPVVLVEGGSFGYNSTASSIEGTAIGMVVDAPKGARAQVGGTLTAPVAVKVINNNSINDNGLWIEKGDNDHGQVIINGKVEVNAGRLVFFSGKIDSSSIEDSTALTVTNDAWCNIQKGVEIVGNLSAVKLSGNSGMDVKGATFKGKDTFTVVYSNNDNPHLQLTDNPYLYTTDKVNGTILKVEGENYLDEMGHNKMELDITSGFLNVPVNKSQFGGLYGIRNRGLYNEGQYECIQYEDLSVDYPYTIYYHYLSNGNSAYVNTNNDNIEPDRDQLDNIKKDKEADEWTVMVSDELDQNELSDAFSGLDIDEAYEIYINAILNGTIKKITECDGYQFVTITTKENQASHTKIHHKHGSGVVENMPKVDLSTGEDMLTGKVEPKECFYVKNKNQVVVVTKRFSTFATSSDESEVPVDSLVPVYTAPIIADDSTYTGSGIDLIKTEGQTEHGTIKYAYAIKDVTAPTTYSKDIPSVIDAGSYDVYYMVEGDKNHTNIDGTKLGTVTINKKTAEVVADPTASGVDYGQKLSSSTLTPNTWNWVDGDIIPTVDNDGYNAILSITDDNNYDYSADSTYNASTHTITRKVDITVNKVSATVTNPTIITGLVFNEIDGTPVAQNLINAGQSQHGTFKYALASSSSEVPADEAFTTTIPQGTNAGTYYVYYKLFGDVNHNDGEKALLEVTIAKKTSVIISDPVSSSITYKQSLANSTLTTGWTWVDSSIVPTVNNSGYDAFAVTTNDNNYDYSADPTYDSDTHKITRHIPITVNKAVPVAGEDFTIPTGLSAVYGQTLADVAFDDTKWAWKDATTLVGEASEQTKDFTAIYTPDNENFKSTEVSVPVKVNKATASVTVSAKQNLVYTGSALELVAVSQKECGTMQFKVDDGDYSESVPTAINAGSHTVYYKASESANYLALSEGSVVVTIAKATPPQITTGVASRITYGKTLADSSLTNDWNWVDSSIVPNVENTGYRAYHAVDDDNYDYSGNSEYNADNHRIIRDIYIIVDKADKTDINIPEIDEKVSGTKLKDITLPSGWSWIDGEQEVSSSNLAKYVDASGNYNDVIVNIPISVKRTLDIAGGNDNVDVKIKTKVKTDETEVKKNDVSIKNDVITETLVDMLTNENSKVVITDSAIIESIKTASSGDTINVETEFESKASDNNEAKDKIKNSVGTSSQSGLSRFLDLSISLSIKINDGAVQQAKISVLSSPIKVSIKLSSDEPIFTTNPGKTLKYYLIRLHDNGDGTFEITKIPATLNPTDKTITADIDKFSVFGIYHEEISNESPSSNNGYVAPKTGDR